MKKLISTCLMFTILTGQLHAQAFSVPDIMLTTRIDFDWSGILIKKLRRGLVNNGYPDPFKMKMDEPLVVSESLIGSYLNESSADLMTDLGSAIGLDIVKGETKVTLHGLSYDIQNFSTELKATEQQMDGLLINADFEATKVNVAADKISLAILLPGKNALPIIDIQIINPVLSAHKSHLIDFSTQFKIKDEGESFRLQVKKADFANMADALAHDPESVAFDFDRIIVPKVSIKVGNKTLDFSPEKIEAMLINRKAALKGLLIAQFSSLLKKGLGEDVLKVAETVSFKKEHWFSNSGINGKLAIAKFNSSPIGHGLEISIPGDFCSTQNFVTYDKGCINDSKSQPAKTRLNKKAEMASLNYMRSLVDRGDANLVASISEDYVNKIIFSTYEAGLWAPLLNEAGVVLGENKAFVRMDERGDSGTFVMDVVYTTTKSERLALGARTVRFPLVLKIGIRIEKHDNTPVLIIRVNGADLSKETLINGRAELGAISTIKNIRLKKKVVAEITKKIQPLLNKDVLEMRYPELKGLGLDKVDFVSDGNGRMNALMHIQDLLNDDDHQ